MIPTIPHLGKAITSDVNVMKNPSFEDGVDSLGYPVGWGNWTKHGTPDSTITANNTRATNGTYSARLDVGRTDIGFIAMFQNLPANMRFRNLSDRPDGLDFWFYQEPKYNGMGDFRVRLLYGENVAELNYVFDPSPALYYPNVTDGNGRPLARTIFLYGYPDGQWHHFQRNVRSDWETLGFGLDTPFIRIQFDALTFSTSDPVQYFAETVWIDDVRLYQDLTPIPHVLVLTTNPASPWMVGETITFDASQSYDPGGTIVSYDWSFGDGTAATGPIATHRYLAAGTFEIRLILTDDEGIQSTWTLAAHVLKADVRLLDLWSEARIVSLQNQVNVTLSGKAINIESYSPWVRVVFEARNLRTRTSTVLYSQVLTLGTREEAVLSSVLVPETISSRYLITAILQFTSRDPATFADPVWYSVGTFSLRTRVLKP